MLRTYQDYGSDEDLEFEQDLENKAVPQSYSTFTLVRLFYATMSR